MLSLKLLHNNFIYLIESNYMKINKLKLSFYLIKKPFYY